MFCTCLAAPHAASAFFCFTKGSGNRGFGRTLAAPRQVYPPAAYRLPPIAPRTMTARQRPPIKRPPPRPPTGRPIN